MDYSRVIEHFGNQGRVAAALGVTQPSISLWKQRGIPLLRQMQIQLVTGGILQASNSRLANDSANTNTNKPVFALPEVGARTAATKKRKKPALLT